jgi:LasA protease
MRTFIRKAHRIYGSCRPWRWLSLLIFVAILIAGIFTAFWNPPHALAALIYPTEGQLTNAEGSNTVQFQSVKTLLSDGQFVWGPNVGNFNLEAFLNGHDSPLASYSKSIESWARYYSINPRVVLALLESNYDLISNFDPSANPDTVHQLIEKTSADLSLAFLQHMYEMGTRQKGRVPFFAQGGQSFEFEDGTLAELTWSPSSASYALAAVESKGKLQNPELSTQAIGGIGDFEAAFGYFFPETDPLDTSNNLEPDTPPPDDYFQLPFPLGATWTFSGVHSWSGSAAYPDRSSLDFSTPWSNYPDSPYKNTVAAAPGDKLILEPNPAITDVPCWVKIDHGGGWSTHYYHLVNLGSSGAVGPTSQNQLIGGIGTETCNGGWASGPHVHFSLFYNGAPYDLEGLKFSGWTIHEEPLGDNLYFAGSIERDGVTLTPWHWLTNDYHTYYGNALDYSLRFFGNTSSDFDRLKIPIDDPARTNPGPPLDLGFHDFVVEWWMKANPSDNSAPAIACGANDNWKASALPDPPGTASRFAVLPVWMMVHGTTLWCNATAGIPQAAPISTVLSGSLLTAYSRRQQRDPGVISVILTALRRPPLAVHLGPRFAQTSPIWLSAGERMAPAFHLRGGSMISVPRLGSDISQISHRPANRTARTPRRSDSYVSIQGPGMLPTIPADMIAARVTAGFIWAVRLLVHRHQRQLLPQPQSDLQSSETMEWLGMQNSTWQIWLRAGTQTSSSRPEITITLTEKHPQSTRILGSTIRNSSILI